MGQRFTEQLRRAGNAERTRIATSPARMLPTCVIIGAMKAGTSSLHHYLVQHPDVGPPARKEVHFFDSARHRSTLRYRSFFPLCGRYPHAVESSPYYLFHPAVPARVRKLLPEAKLVVLLRDPVMRTYSHYNHVRTRGREDLSFAEALAAEPSRLRGEHERLLRDPTALSHPHRAYSYVERSVYTPQIARWYEHFPREQLLILQSEDLFEDPGAVLARTQAWLGLRPHVPDDLRPMNTRSYDAIDESVAAGLRERFAEDHATLEQLTGLSFRWA